MSEYAGAQYDLDLTELFGEFPSSDRALKEAIGGEVLDTIVNRTLKGFDVEGNKFKGYSAEYIKSLAFKANGKEKSRVDLKLSGDMLGTMDVVKSDGAKLSIGWTDKLQQAKAHNHNTGDTLPKRQFLGLSDKEKKQIAAKFLPDVQKSLGGAKATKDEKAALSFFDKVLARFK